MLKNPKTMVPLFIDGKPIGMTSSRGFLKVSALKWHLTAIYFPYILNGNIMVCSEEKMKNGVIIIRYLMQ